MQEAKYRHEYKYLISAGQRAILESRIKGILKPDPHAGENGIYNISSLYFDDYYDSCYYDNMSGTDPREKYRIRIYGHSDERISLECKRKERGKTLKTACLIDRPTCEMLMNGEYPAINENTDPVLAKLILNMMTRKMKPVIIVEYDRIPYIYKDGNVRVTFDINVSSSNAIHDFLECRVPKRPIMPTGNQILEVKFDEFIPDFVHQILQIDNLQLTAYSKYYLCRNYSMR